VVSAIGECTGVAGVAAAQLQGRIAGAAVAADLACTHRSIDPGPAAALAREFAFAQAIATTFAAPARWAERLRDDTLICRCEDVPWSAVRGCADLRSAKLATRCGMGHCQGRLCHDTLATVMHWPRLPVRPPLMPTALGCLLAIDPDTTLSNEEIPR
jgi:NAD(P)H-nitrite reductase large subunit